MLKRIFSPQETRNFCLPIGEARFPSPFSHLLEFNPPAHGVWNIVHVGMQVPEAHQIYVCGVNCMRGVVLTAAEMGEARRFSMVLLEEKDILLGRVEQATLEGVTEALKKLPALPPVVLVFTVCTHRFLGCDLNFLYRELEKRFPKVTFLRCFMEPITQKGGLSADQRLRKTMFDPLPQCLPREKTAAILGSDFSLEPDADLRRMLQNGGWTLLELQSCGSYQEFLGLSQAEVLVSVFPRAKYGAEETARRLCRRHFYLPAAVSYEEIAAQEALLTEQLGLPPLDAAAEKAACEAALDAAKAAVGDAAIAIDYTVHPRPLGLARLLVAHGFRVKTVYLDSVSAEEREDFLWLKANAPELLLSATIRPELRTLPRGSAEKTVAIGQIAAWRKDTPWFVNLVEGGGLWGYAGIRRMAEAIGQAAGEEKDPRDLVPRKGLGCVSLI